MFRQSIDPKGAFPPKSSKKPVKKKKKKPIKRRKKTRDRFGAERKQEQVFKFGEVRSGLSGRQIFRPPQEQSNFSPGDYLRIHQEAIANQLREQAEKKATGGTFTGTSIAEERRVKEQQQADREFRRQEADTRRRFVGALERFVEKATQPPPEQKPDKEVLGALGDIKEEIKQTKIKLSDEPKRESIGIADIEEVEPVQVDRFSDESSISSIATPIPEHRKPEDDITFLSLDRSSRSNTKPPSSDRPRPTPSNPSLSTSIPSQEKIDEDTFVANLERQREQFSQVDLSQEEQQEIRFKLYDKIVGGLTQPKPQELGYREPRPEPEQELTIEEFVEETPSPRTQEQKERQRKFLQEQEDTAEFLTPTSQISPTKTPPELKEQLEEIKKATEEKRDDPIPEDPEAVIKIEAGFEKLTPEEIVKRAKEVQKEAEEDLAQDTSTEEETAEEEKIRLEARLQTYQALADLQKPPGSNNPSFDGKPAHYRLVILEDIPPETLGRHRNQPGFKKGDQHRMKNIQNSDANRGMNFYKRNDGKMDLSSGNLGKVAFRINFETQGEKIQKAIREGKVKIVYDEFEDEI